MRAGVEDIEAGVDHRAMVADRAAVAGKGQAGNEIPDLRKGGGFGCHAVRYSEPVPPAAIMRHGFGVLNRVAPNDSEK